MDMIFETANYIKDWVTENIFIVIPALTFLWTMYVYKKDNFNGSPHEANKFIDLLNSEDDTDYKKISIQQQTLRYVAEIVDHLRFISAILMSIMVFLFLYALK